MKRSHLAIAALAIFPIAVATAFVASSLVSEAKQPTVVGSVSHPMDRAPQASESAALSEPTVRQDDTPVAPAPEPSARVFPSCADGTRLTLVAMSHKTAKPYAALLEPGHTTVRLRRIGDVVGKRILDQIEPKRVWLRDEDGRCYIVLDRSRPASTATAQVAEQPPAKADTQYAADIKRLAPNDIEVSSQLRDRLFEKPQELMRSRVVPEQVNDTTVGVRIHNVRPDSVLAMLGVENGDRLDSVNGFPITDPQRVLEAYARLRYAERYVVVVNRGGKAMNLDIRVR